MIPETYKILIVDDDLKLCKLLNRFLSQCGFICNEATSGFGILQVVEKFNPDLILLDVMLPGGDGFEVLRKIRKASEIPVIMLTARGDTSDRIVGLQMGADDYLPKPFEPDELKVRIYAVLRRVHLNSVKNDRKEIISFGKYQLDTKQRKILTANSLIELTFMEFRLLEYFLQNSNQVISRNQLAEFLYGDDFDPDRRSLDILISRLRKKIADNIGKPQVLKTIHGQGYLFQLS